ncbi:hypothetical protein [Streptomyces sp. NPDC127114]|uniref:hypothetical protein n=1 Tax=Streptomyces sp. NPDC127114 TaxID=3345366 RepID=UPI003639FA0C
MPHHVGVDRDILFFSDRHFTAGGVTDGTFPATALTQGAILLLRDIFFPEAGDQQTTPSEDDLTLLIGRGFPTLSLDEARAAGEALVRDVPFLTSVAESPTLGEVEVTDHETSGWLNLAVEEPVFRAAGTLYRRTVGSQTVYFSVGAQSLAGVVRPNPSLAVLNMDATGVQLHMAESSKGPACGACGVCGTCIICAEINYAVAGVSAVALTALTSVAEELVAARKTYSENRDRPAPGAPPQDGRKPLLTRAAELEEALAPLLKIADEAAGVELQRGKSGGAHPSSSSPAQQQAMPKTAPGER